VFVKNHLQKLSLIVWRLTAIIMILTLNSIMANRKPDDICIFHINIRSLRKNIDKLSNMLSTM